VFISAEMATQVDESTVKLNPKVVGNVFAEQYYNTLSKSPELLHNFYNDLSLISRPGLDGSVSSASTLEVRSVQRKFYSLPM
jgi:Ras GTPase-activating protein-binding protein 1